MKSYRSIEEAAVKAKDYLYQLKSIDNCVRTNLEEILRLEELLENKAVSLKDINIQSSGAHDAIGSQVPKIVDIMNETEEYIGSMLDIREHAKRVIKEIKDHRLQTILMKYYIHNKTFEQTAVEMDLTYRWIVELHGQALNEYEVIEEKLCTLHSNTY